MNYGLTDLLLLSGLLLSQFAAGAGIGAVGYRLGRASGARHCGDNLQLPFELAITADSVSRFLVWLRFHGIVGEVDFSNLHTLYQEFCQLTGDTPETTDSFAKRLVRCGVDKLDSRWMHGADGKRSHRLTFYWIPPRGEVDDEPEETDVSTSVPAIPLQRAA